MSRDQFRTIGALTGLVLGILFMLGLGMGGLMPAAIFGAGGAVAGGMSGEKIYDRRGGSQ